MKHRDKLRQFQMNNTLIPVVTVLVLFLLFGNLTQPWLRNNGSLALLQGDVIKAKMIFERFEVDETWKYWHLYRIYEQINEPDKARIALRATGYDWQTLMRLGDMYIWPTQDYANALSWYAGAQKINENSTLLYQQGHVHALMGDFELAIDFYNQALQMDSFKTEEIDVSNTLVRLASIYDVAFADDEEAWELAARALAVDEFGTHLEDKAYAYYLQGRIESSRGEDPQISIAKYNLALDVVPDYYWANLMLGWDYYRAERPLTESVSQIEYAISLDPQNKWGYLILAGLYVDIGNIPAARELYEQVLELDSNDSTAIEFIQDNP